MGRWLDAKVICGHELLDREVRLVHGCDLMSDLLAFSQDGSLLLTGLTNAQAVRTCEVAGIVGVIFVRGKTPAEVVIALAQELELPLLSTRHSMFEACGMLYGRGLHGVTYEPKEASLGE